MPVIGSIVTQDGDNVIKGDIRVTQDGGLRIGG
jgi:hypothetical protein